MAWNVSSTPFRSKATLRCSLWQAPKTKPCGDSCKSSVGLEGVGEGSAEEALTANIPYCATCTVREGAWVATVREQYFSLWKVLEHCQRGKSIKTKGQQKTKMWQEDCFFFSPSQHISASQRGMFQTWGKVCTITVSKQVQHKSWGVRTIAESFSPSQFETVMEETAPHFQAECNLNH